MKKISITGIFIALILIVIGFVFPILKFIGIGFILATILNNILLKIDNTLFFRKTFISQSSNNIQSETIPIQEKIKYNENLSKKYLELKNCFKEYRQIDLFDELATTSLVQLERSSEKFERFIEILNNKFNPEELAYSKFFTTVEQVYMAILENLDYIEDKLKGIGGKDYSYLLERLDNFEKMEKLTQPQVEEMSSIRQKKGMVKKEIKIIQQILATTEGVISNLDKILMETSNLKTSSSKLDVSGTHAILELEQLIKNAKMYNII